LVDETVNRDLRNKTEIIWLGQTDKTRLNTLCFHILGGREGPTVKGKPRVATTRRNDR